MAPRATFAPVARPPFAAASFLRAVEQGRSVLAEGVALAFAVRADDGAGRRAR